jgi:hypothetical protein
LEVEERGNAFIHTIWIAAAETRASTGTSARSAFKKHRVHELFKMWVAEQS